MDRLDARESGSRGAASTAVIRGMRSRLSLLAAALAVAGAFAGVAAMPAAAAPGDVLWMQTWLPRSDFTKYGAKQVLRGPGGDLWLGVGGSTSSTNDPYAKRMCVARYTPGGVRRWARVLPSPVDMTHLVGISVDRWRNTAVAGWRLDYEAPSGYPWVLTKLSPAGKRLWTRTCSSPVVANNCLPKAVARDSKGAFYVAGTMARSATGADVALVKYSAAGVKKWQRYIDGYEGSVDAGVCVAVDGSDRVYVTGTVGSFFSGTDVVVARYRTDGTRVWNRVWDNTDSADTAFDLSAGPAGAAVAGTSTGMPDGDDRGFIVTVTPGGTVAEYVTTVPGKDVSWKSVAMNAVGDVAAGGSVVAGSTSYFAYARYRPAGTDSLAYYSSPVGGAWCYGVWIGADATTVATGVWNSGMDPGETYLDTHIVCDVVTGTDWRRTLAMDGLQSGDAVLATGSAVHVLGESGYPVAFWSLQR
jgi:hypothetical protein